jgi:WD40 repeat protein
MTSRGPIHDAQTGKRLRKIGRKNRYAHHLVFTPAGHLLLASSDASAAGSFVVELLDADGKKTLFSRRIDPGRGADHVAHSSVPGEGRNVYFAVKCDGVYRWTPQTDELVRLFVQDTDVTHFAVADDERLAVTAGGNTAYVWTLPDGKKKLTLKHPLTCSGAAFLPGGRLLTACYDGLVRIWDASGGSEILALDLGMGKIYSFAASPDHMTFAAGVEKSSRIVLMDVPE